MGYLNVASWGNNLDVKQERVLECHYRPAPGVTNLAGLGPKTQTYLVDVDRMEVHIHASALYACFEIEYRNHPGPQTSICTAQIGSMAGT